MEEFEKEPLTGCIFQFNLLTSCVLCVCEVVLMIVGEMKFGVWESYLSLVGEYMPLLLSMFY